MGDSLIGRTAGFDPVSPGSSPGPPAKYKFIYMKIILFYFILLLVSKTTLSSQYTYIKIFKETLSSYNITFEDLGDKKSGAICVPDDDNQYSKYAIGFSYDMYEEKKAKEVALSGCLKMKRKVIPYDCKCEIIL